MVPNADGRTPDECTVERSGMATFPRFSPTSSLIWRNWPHLHKKTVHNFGCLIPVDTICAFFHQAVAERVEIKGTSLKQHEGKLYQILKTAKFRKLDIEISNEESCKTFLAVAQWLSARNAIRKNHKGFIADDVLLGVITDDVLLGVIGTSTGSINLYCPQPLPRELGRLS
ncbi:hypothetical protein PRIPAC_90030, partial [Pristionchus pacificus]|uniref:Uncharacterized protein n=1 Tax=Pristionchus pacificus TaxID=54126 RepID=A0A2A6B8C3_PRIPA